MTLDILARTPTYALRAMSVLARLDPGEMLPAAELSERTGVPVHYLSKVMRMMVLAGLVRGQKGRGGGFSLGRPPARITFAEILDATGFGLETGRCVFGLGRCNAKDPCHLHSAWDQLQRQIHAWARQHSLADTRVD